jgi:DNA polymerase/3'-5' exonuclease PolX
LSFGETLRTGSKQAIRAFAKAKGATVEEWGINAILRNLTFCFSKR